LRGQLITFETQLIALISIFWIPADRKEIAVPAVW
jgi:hypothetical protein